MARPSPHGDLRLPKGRVAPKDAVRWRVSTSGGPGGQHANRTASRVELIINLDRLGLNVRETALIMEQLSSRSNAAGEIVVSCHTYRDQLRNRREAIQRAERLIAKALETRAHRSPTQPTKGARLRAREHKQQQSSKKRSRSWRPNSASFDE